MTEYPKPAFAVRLSSAIKCRPFISKETYRYYLAGIYFEPCEKGGVLCAATDGHRLGIAHDRDGVVYEPTIAMLPAVVKPEKAFLGEWLVCILTAPNRGYIAIVAGHKKEGQEDTPEYAIERVEECRLRVGGVVIDGTFPDYKGVIPTPKPEAVVRHFNREYMRSFGEHITLIGDDEKSPHLVQTKDSDFIGVLMPMRGERRSVPDWIAVEEKA